MKNKIAREPSHDSRNKKFYLFFLFFILALFIYGWRLYFPTTMYFDEVYRVKTAQQFIALRGYTERVHPPLGMLLISLSILMLGDYSPVWRLSALLAGIGCIYAIYAITRKLTRNSRTGFWAAFLFALNGISLPLARIATFESVMLFFMLLSILCFLENEAEDGQAQAKAFFFSGVFLGLALATRWVAATLLGPLALLWFKRYRESKNRMLLIKHTLIFFGIIPALIYFSSYLIVPFIKGFHGSDIWKLQTNALHYHLTLKAGHHYASKWWTWPFMIRPIWYYFQRQHGLVYGILCIGNPAICWTIPVAMGYAGWRFFKEKSLVTLLIIVGFLTQWVAWAPVRRVTFFHYFNTAMPFVTMAAALVLEQLWQNKKFGRWVAIGYLLLVTGMFIYWYPLLTGYPISEWYFRNHLWFKSWV